MKNSDNLNKRSTKTGSAYKPVNMIKVFVKNLVKVFGLLKENFVSYPVHTVKVCFVRPHKFWSLGRHYSNSCAFVYIDLDSKDVLLGQFPSKCIKVFIKIGWVSIPSKSIRVLWQSFWCSFTRSKKTLTKCLMKNFDRVNGP
jgi:hypothetical protein